MTKAIISRYAKIKMPEVSNNFWHFYNWGHSFYYQRLYLNRRCVPIPLYFIALPIKFELSNISLEILYAARS